MGLDTCQAGTAIPLSMQGTVAAPDGSFLALVGPGVLTGCTVNGTSGFISGGTCLIGHICAYGGGTPSPPNNGTWDVYVVPQTFVNSGLSATGYPNTAGVDVGVLDYVAHGASAPNYGSAALICTVTSSGADLLDVVVNPTGRVNILPYTTLMSEVGALEVGPCLGACEYVATTNISTLSGLTATPDGGTLIAGIVVLLTAQTTTTQNGPWIVGTGAWSRPTWYTSGTSIPPGAFVVVYGGTSYALTFWGLTATAAITVDTTATTWRQLGGDGNGSPITVTTASFAIATGSVNIPVSSSGPFAAGQTILVNDGTHLVHYLVTAISTGTITATAVPQTGDSALSGTMASGAVVAVAGLQGANAPVLTQGQVDYNPDGTGAQGCVPIIGPNGVIGVSPTGIVGVVP